MTRHGAIDLGASGGRVVVAEVGRERLDLTVVHRFANTPVRLPDGLHWDVLGLFRNVLDGLVRAGDVATVGIDSWGVDYGLLDITGALLGNPHHYRDSRTDSVIDKVHGRLPFAELYRLNGLQFLPFNTIYQLAAAEGTLAFASAETLLLVPDLIGFWLTGTVGAEVTNASTTGLLDVCTRQWSIQVLDALGIRSSLLPELRQPGQVLGTLSPDVRDETGLSAGICVVAVGSHDTASAVVGVPMASDRAAYISLGTWGLVGIELDGPVITDASREANFTNEVGVDGRVRYLRNVMGLWLLQESMRGWGREDVAFLLAAAAELPRGAVFDVDDPRLLPPGDMPARIATLVEEAGHPRPNSAVQVVRAIVDSLAAALARTVEDTVRLSGRDVTVVHVVGGGAQNVLLCQLIADGCGRPVIAGPVEATALGNALVQARACGTLRGDLEVLRDLVGRTQQLTRFEPRG